MKKRRFLAALLAVACAASLSVSAFAEPDIPEDISDDAKEALQGAIDNGGGLVVDGGTVGGVDVEATVQMPTLAVVLPKKVEVFVNPYRAEVKTGEDADGNEIKSIDTVVSPEMTVVNGSNCAVKISVKGQFVTYKFSDEQIGTAVDTSNGETITGWATVPGADSTADLFKDGTVYYVKANAGTVAEPEYQYRAVVVKFTAANATTGAAAKYEITGYAATASIKVATAAVKEDTDRTNSIFVYVEGRDENGTYPATYTKAVAGLDAKGNVIVGGQYALAAKEGSGPVLYLGGNGTTGYMRVTGSAATAPTKTWTEVQETEGFDTPFVFIVDPVANAAENPELKTMAITGGTLSPALATGKYVYDVKVPQGTASVVLNTTVNGDVKALAKGTADGTVVKSVANTGTSKVTLTVDAAAAVNAKGSATFTVTSDHNKVNTYTINVTIVAAS